jgi:hypothetical protein
MRRTNKKGKQKQGYDVVKAIDTIERAAKVAVKLYRTVQPIARVIITKGRRTK